MFVISMKNILKKACSALSVLITLTISLAVFSADNYQVTDLGKFDGNNAESFAINEQGVIVGLSNVVRSSNVILLPNGDLNINHAFVYQNDLLIDLGFLTIEGIPEGNSAAYGINNNNIAVGFSTQTLENGEVDDDGDPILIDVNVGTYYDIANLTVNPLPQVDPGSPREARAISINDNNIIVGFANLDPPDDADANGDPLSTLFDRGFFYDIASDQMTIIGTLDNDDTATVVLRAINNDGFAVGVSSQVVDGRDTRQVFTVDLSDPSNLTLVQIFGGLVQLAWDVNSSQKIVGSAITETSGDLEAFVHDVQTGTTTSLGSLNDNLPFSEAFGINDSDQIVGTSQVQSSPRTTHAFIFENGTMKDLSKLIGCDTGWIIQEARAINNSGVITGNGIFQGERRAFALTPLAGTAPDCDDSGSGGGGSIPLGGLYSLLLLSFFGKRNKH